MGVVHRELVERKRWLTSVEFADHWAVAQTLPGPNVVNLVLLLGARSFGVSGAVVAVSGLLLAPLALIMVIAALASRATDVPSIQGAIRGMGAVAAGLIAATAFRLADAIRRDVLGDWATWGSGVAMFSLVALLEVPLAIALLVVGPVVCTWAYKRLRHQRSSGAFKD